MKQRLFTPGPTPVPDDVLRRMAAPLGHHRQPEFRELFRRVQDNLQYVLCTVQPVIPLVASGTGAMEAVVTNLCSPGDTVVSVNGGKFGQRWVDLPRAFGMNVVEVRIPWGKAVGAGTVVDALRHTPRAHAVFLTHSETSTGTTIDLEGITKEIRAASDALICADGITSIGAHEVRFDAWGLDACVVGSQKGLMIPPGLAFVALSARARAVVETCTTPRFYFDLARAYAAAERGDTPWTPAISLIAGLDTALAMMRSEGVEHVWERHRRLAAAVRAGVTGMGMRLFSESPSNAVTTVWLPEGLVWEKMSALLKREEGVILAGGQGEYAGKIFRIAHLGYVDDLDVFSVLAALERVLPACGWPVAGGAGVAAAQESLRAMT